MNDSFFAEKNLKFYGHFVTVVTRATNDRLHIYAVVPIFFSFTVDEAEKNVFFFLYLNSTI